MKQIISFVLMLGLILPLTAAKQDVDEAFKDVEHVEGTSIYFDEEVHDFGEIEEGVQATHVFKFYNNGDEPLIINRVRPSCGCTVSEYTREPVQPGEAGEIHAEYDSNNRGGNFSTSIRVNSNAGTDVLRITGEVK